MQKNLDIRINRKNSISLWATTFTVMGFESTVYSVIMKNIETGETLEYYQYDTEVKAQRKFDRYTK